MAADLPVMEVLPKMEPLPKVDLPRLDDFETINIKSREVLDPLAQPKYTQNIL
jgi:hypothetical protein